MTVIEGVRSFLLAQPSIAAVVVARVYPLRLPQGSPVPSVTLTRVSDVGDAQLRGPNALSQARVQVDCWARSHDDATALGDLCRGRLDGYAGLWSGAGSPTPMIRVQGILQDIEQDLFEEDILGGLCRHSADYLIHYVDLEAQVLTTT